MKRCQGSAGVCLYFSQTGSVRCLGHVVLISGERYCGQDANDRNYDHEFYKSESSCFDNYH